MGQYEPVLAASAEVVIQEEAKKGVIFGPKIQSTTAPGMPKEKSPLVKQAISPTTLAMNENVNSNQLASCGHHFVRLMFSANNLSVLVGIMIAAVPFVQNILFTDPRGVLRPLGAAINVRLEIPTS